MARKDGLPEQRRVTAILTAARGARPRSIDDVARKDGLPSPRRCNQLPRLLEARDRADQRDRDRWLEERERDDDERRGAGRDDEKASRDRAIGDDNLGKQMLSKMGWSEVHASPNASSHGTRTSPPGATCARKHTNTRPALAASCPVVLCVCV